MHIERPPEYEGKTKDVVHLVRVVTATGSHDHILAGIDGVGVGYLGVRVSHSKHYGVFGHRLYHLLTHQVFDRHSDKDISIFHSVRQGMAVGLSDKLGLVLVEGVAPALVHHPLGIDHQHIFMLDAKRTIQFRTGNSRRSGPGEDHPHLVDLFTDKFQRVQQCGGRDDGRTVLVVMENRDIHRFFQGFFDIEAFGCFDIFKIDAAKGRLQQLTALDNLVGVFGVELYVKDIDIGKPLEQHPLTFHYRFPGCRPDIAQPQHRRTIGYHRYQIALGGVFVNINRIFVNFQTRLSHSGGVG